MSRQFSLFDDDAPARAVQASVEPCAVEPDIAALAHALPRELRLGASSWYFPGWAGLVYARAYDEKSIAREGLAAYARHPLLRTVGIDRTFHAPIAEAEYRRYAAQVPDDFRFLVKAPMACTAPRVREADGAWRDNPRFLDAAFATTMFVAPCVAGLGEKAGVLLFQFPPQPAWAVRDAARWLERLDAFFSALPPLPRDVCYAVELRNPQLLEAPGYAAMLARRRVRHCIGIHPSVPDLSLHEALERAAGPGPLVARWNLSVRAGLAYDDAKASFAPFDRLRVEDADTRGWLARHVVARIGAGERVVVIVNNKAEGSAPRTLIELARRVAAQRDAASASTRPEQA